MKIISHSHKNTFDFGVELAKTLKGGEIIALNADMGCGKTVLAKGIAKGLGIDVEVTSPTFSILNIYHGRLTLCHYDCYRLSGSNEAFESGLDEYFGEKNHVCVVEWAQNISNLLKQYNTISINIAYIDENTRQIEST